MVLVLLIVGHCKQLGLVSARDYVPVVAWVVIDGGAVREYYPTWRKSRVGPNWQVLYRRLLKKQGYVFGEQISHVRVESKSETLHELKYGMPRRRCRRTDGLVHPIVWVFA
jgi:hypothetical protein